VTSPRPERILLYFLMACFVFTSLVPFWTALMTALKTAQDVIYTMPLQPPASPTLGAFVEAFDIMKRPLLNSFAFTTLATIFSCGLGSLNGYILTKIRFRGSGIVFLLLAIGIFIPYQTVLIPLVVTISDLGLYNTIQGLVLTHTAFGIPICTLLFRNFYEDIPDSLVRAAKTDGAGTWTIYRRIVFPLSSPMFAVAGVLQFTSIWNDFLFGLVLARGTEALPASVALANLKGTTTAFWNVQMAGAWLYALPVVIIYLILGKYLIQGYMVGAVKG
jgi:glucose/mannose transport system permease protein